LRLYRWLFSMGPISYRAEYEEPTMQVFRQCCRDAYRRKGTVGVLLLWLPMFSEVIFGMTAEQFTMLRRAYERIEMLPTMRRSMIITLCAFTFILLAVPLFIWQAILRSEFSVKMLRYAFVLMSIATLAMSISCIATITWIVSFWIGAPEIAASQGLGPAGLRGNIGGSEGVVIVVVMMALAAVATIFALRRGLSARVLAAV
jgi:hypothetical protein